MQPDQQKNSNNQQPQQVQPQNQSGKNNPSQVQPGDVYAQGSSSANQRRYAGFWIRFLAYIIDSFVLAIPYLALFSFVGAVGTDSSASSNLLSFAVAFLYYVFMESSEKQATVGKMALSLKVIDENGGRLSLQKASIRHLSKLISGIILFIGFIMAGFDSQKQALHDKIANTYVVKSN